MSDEQTNAAAAEAIMRSLDATIMRQAFSIQALRAERDALRAENARLKGAIAAAKQAWDALGRCADEFLPEYPGTCIEYQDALDGALIVLWQAVCDHAVVNAEGFCPACRLKVEG